MKKILFLLSICMLAFSSCVDKVKTGDNTLTYDQLYEMQTEINQLLAESQVGDADGCYPQSSFDDLESALVNLKRGISQAHAGVFILQFEVDNYVNAAQKAINLFKASVNKKVDPGTPAELFVNGIDHKGHIDFGSSTSYTPSNFTVETWTKLPDGFIEFTFGSFISTFISPLPYKGWTLHYWGTSNSLLRFSIGSNNSNPDATLPTIYTAAPTTFGIWFHVAAVFDTSAKKMKLFINGELKASYDIADAMVPCAAGDESRMWAFVEPKDNSRCMSGYIKKFRLWGSAKSDAEVKQLMTTDVKGTEENLICAWDFTEKPTDDSAILDKTGKHTAKLVGVYKWTATN
jgi:hypothetical protein